LPARPAVDEAPGDVDVAALRRHGDRLVRPGDADHAVNVVAAGPPGWLTDAFAHALTAELTSYPAEAEAEAVLAGLYGRSPGEVVATNGAAQALWLLPAALRPARAAVIHPLFTEAEAALHAHGVPVTRVLRDPHAAFELDPSDVPDDADLVLVGNPAAATGTLSPRSLILGLRQPGRTVVVDEAFMDLVPGETESLVGDAVPDVIVVRSFTKSLSIPGVRAGAAIAAAPLAARLRAVQPPWSVNAFALAGLVALGQHPGELAARATQAAQEREELVGGLASLPGVRVWPSATNHVLAHVDRGARVAAALRARQIAVRPCGTFPGLTDDHLRITARDPQANAAFVIALREALDAVGRA
ncbi:MAG: aminotransferase class I/II-fold pyridoxal phosphate-dependent enzyme, partial [Solirubrobacteraceae bacterium]